MKTIAFASIKGGTGKSSLAILTANMLAQRHNRVLVIDMDVQNSTTFYYLEKADAVEQKNIARALQTQEIASNVLTTHRNNVELLGSHFELIDLRAISEKRLALIIKQVEKDYDFCIIDCAPTYDNLVLNAFNAADFILTPILQAQFDFKSAVFLKNRLTLDTDCFSKWRLLFNFYKEPRSCKSILAQYTKLFESSFDNILQVKIPFSSHIRKSIDAGVEITLAQRKRKLYEAFEDLIKWFSGTKNGSRR